jgi:hypothetical protein
MKTFLLLIVFGGSLFLMSHRTPEHQISLADKAILKSFDHPDEVREFSKGKLELVMSMELPLAVRPSSPDGNGQNH